LIARFADAQVARETAAELAEFFDAQERIGGTRYEDGALATLARTNGFDWSDHGAGDTGPSVTVDDQLVIVQHTYCLGLGPGIPAHLADRGGEPSHETTSEIHVSVLFRAVADPILDDELAAIAAQPTRDGGLVDDFKAPWVEHRERGTFAFYRDAGMVGLWSPIDARDLVQLRAWLHSHDIDDAIVQLDCFEDRRLFAALAMARCTACGTTLEYLDPRLHDIESPQLVCTPCGGLYELAVFTEETP